MRYQYSILLLATMAAILALTGLATHHTLYAVGQELPELIELSFVCIFAVWLLVTLLLSQMITKVIGFSVQPVYGGGNIRMIVTLRYGMDHFAWFIGEGKTLSMYERAITDPT